MANTTKANENIKKRAMPNAAHRTSCCFRALLCITAANSITKWIIRMKQKQTIRILKKRESTRIAIFSLPFNIFSLSTNNKGLKNYHNIDYKFFSVTICNTMIIIIVTIKYLHSKINYQYQVSDI